MPLRLKVLVPLLIWLPLILVSLLFAAAHWRFLDPITLKTPMPIRAGVAEASMSLVGWGDVAAWDRAIRFNPNNKEAWHRRCSSFAGSDPATRINNCVRVIALDPSPSNFRDLAIAQEEVNPCQAEQTMKSAIPGLRAEEEAQSHYFLSDVGRMELMCGDLQQSLASFQEAEAIDLLLPSDSKGTPSMHTLDLDRGYISVIYRKMGRLDESRKICKDLYPDFKTATCEIDSKGMVTVTGRNSEP